VRLEPPWLPAPVLRPARLAVQERLGCKLRVSGLPRLQRRCVETFFVASVSPAR
jgi:hypothetical protein